MMAINPRRSREAAGLLVIDIHSRTRALPTVLGAALLLAMAASVLHGVPLLATEHAAPLAMVGFCALGALYNERWLFDAGHGAMTRQVGLVFAYASHRVPFADIGALRLTGIIVPRPVRADDPPGQQPVAGWRSYVTLEIETLGRRRYRIEQARGRRSLALLSLGRQLAARMALSLDDRVVEAEPNRQGPGRGSSRAEARRRSRGQGQS
jgi:hypothetical protein